MIRYTVGIHGHRSDGSPYNDVVNVLARDKEDARRKVENTFLEGEKITYVGEGDSGEEIPEARG
jgi:hypothetical protein